MRKILFSLSIFWGLNTQAQLIADPSIEQVSFTDLAGNPINDTMPIGYISQLNIPIRNLDGTNGIPSGSCKIKIGLGTKIILDPTFNIALASTSDYFDWSASFTGGQVQISGELRTPLPPHYSGVARFNVMGNILDYSTITTNFLITNHNTQVILSDEDPGNNSSFRLYKIIPVNPTPVHFGAVIATEKDCMANILFKAEDEINVKQYDIETSSNGIEFKKAGSLAATNNRLYHYTAPLTGSTVMYIRIRSIDINGDYQFSDICTLNGNCTSTLELSLFPNPVVSTSEVTIKADRGILDGQYEVVLYDMAGRKISTARYTLNNRTQFTYQLGTETAGQYILTVINKETNISNAVFMIQKK